MRGKKVKELRKRFNKTASSLFEERVETNVHFKEFVIGQKLNDKGKLEDVKVSLRLCTITNPRKHEWRRTKRLS